MPVPKVVPGYDPATQCGPLINKEAVSQIASWTDEAVGQVPR
jgi:succinate-semialdehyde dehydrogenase/glutarate-semialdehyde dehydrogenase